MNSEIASRVSNVDWAKGQHAVQTTEAGTNPEQQTEPIGVPEQSVSPKVVNALAKQLLERVQTVRWLLVLTVALSLMSGALLIIQSYGLAQIVNSVFLRHAIAAQVLHWLWAILFLIVMRSVLLWLSQVLAANLAIRVKASLRQQLLSHVLRLGPAYTAGEKRGELVNTAMAGIEQLEDFLAKYLPQMALAVLLPLAFLATVLTQDWLTALLLAATGPLIVFFMILVGKLAESASARQWRQLSILAAWFLDLLQGLTALKLFGRSRAQVKWMGQASEAYRSATMRTLRVAFLSSFLLELFATLGTAVVAVSLGLRLISGHIPFLTAFFVLLLTPEFFQPIRQLGTEFHAGLNGVAAAGSLFEVLDARPLGLDGGEVHGKDEGDGDGQVVQTEPPANAQQREAADAPDFLPPHHKEHMWPVSLQSVSFTYEGSASPALENINLTLEPGQKIAVVGPSGSGKSTLLDLIQGFLSPTTGFISLGDTFLTEWDARNWRRQVAALRQTTHLFATSVRENILMSRPDAEISEVEAAAQAAQAHDFIERLPQGYDTVVGEGGLGLSGGQVQRIAIARAILKDAPILLLDEPTRHLDPATELLVGEGLEKLMANRTVVVVAHKLSTVQNANHIVVLKNGRIVEQGTHNSLMAGQGLYSNLYAAQRQEAVHEG